MENRILKWSGLKREIHEVYEPIKSVCKKMRAEIEFQDDVLSADKAINKIDLFLEKAKSKSTEDLLVINLEVLKQVREQLKLFVDSADDLDTEEKEILYYILVKEESEDTVADILIPC